MDSTTTGRSRAGSRPMQSMQMHRSEKKLPMHSSVRFLPQIIRNSTFCENTRPIMQKFQQSYFFPRNDYDIYSKFTSKRFVFPKTCPRTNTLTFPPLIYIAMFQNLLFNNVNIKIFILDFVYVFESACIKCVYAIAHMSDYM